MGHSSIHLGLPAQVTRMANLAIGKTTTGNRRPHEVLDRVRKAAGNDKMKFKSERIDGIYVITRLPDND